MELVHYCMGSTVIKTEQALIPAFTLAEIAREKCPIDMTVLVSIDGGITLREKRVAAYWSRVDNAARRKAAYVRHPRKCER